MDFLGVALLHGHGDLDWEGQPSEASVSQPDSTEHIVDDLEAEDFLGLLGILSSPAALPCFMRTGAGVEAKLKLAWVRGRSGECVACCFDCRRSREELEAAEDVEPWLPKDMMEVLEICRSRLSPRLPFDVVLDICRSCFSSWSVDTYRARGDAGAEMRLAASFGLVFPSCALSMLPVRISEGRRSQLVSFRGDGGLAPGLLGCRGTARRLSPLKGPFWKSSTRERPSLGSAQIVMPGIYSNQMNCDGGQGRHRARLQSA
mmetsp:Transcript_158816/g.509124  ORF Transcript_158816/g.509124 Transcript_158816/m.509124 type:complete len:260 (+) Transcript_158816:369-1148(+)